MRSRYIAAVQDKPWWLAGGIPASACVAAYQPKGASSYEASKVNLANPGVYNAVDGAAYPTWNVSTGWTGNGVDQYLLTVKPSTYWSMIIRTNRTSGKVGFLGYVRQETPLIHYGYYYGNVPNVDGYTGHHYTHYVRIKGLGASFANHIFAIARNKVYLNGVYVNQTAATNNVQALYDVALFARNYQGTIDSFTAATIPAVAFYNTELTNYQVAALTAAMNAL